MKLYLLVRQDSVDYDEFDSFVISAKNWKNAMRIAETKQRGLYSYKTIGKSYFKIQKTVHSSFKAG